MKRAFWGLTALLVQVGWAASPLKVTIGLAEKTIDSTGPVPILATIQNTGSRAEILRLYSCSSQDNWATDPTAVEVVRVSCRANTLENKVLGYGQSYTTRVYVHLLSSSRFKLGFINAKADDKSGAAEPVWSNTISMVVTPRKEELTFKPSNEKGQVLKPGEKAPPTTLENSSKVPAVSSPTAQ